MKLYIFIFISIICGNAQNVPPYTEDCQHDMYQNLERTVGIPSTYQVSLDESPRTRWNHVVNHKLKEIHKAIGVVEKLMADFSPKIVQAIDKYLPILVNKLPEPYNEELKGIAATTKIPYGEILLFNIFYEVFTACTSIVATNSSGYNIHARNLDFGLFMGWDQVNNTWLLTEALRPLVVNIDFTRQNQTVYKSVHFAGYIGVITGMKTNAFTLSLNERFNINGGYIGLLEWILGIRSGSWTTFLMRDVLEKANSYEEAVNLLSKTQILAPVYFIVGGVRPFEGSIITRDRSSLTDLLSINSTKEGWYVLQTNYDNWKNPPFFDDRRTTGLKCMSETTTEKISFGTIYDVLSTKPVMNLLTTYTTLMQVNEGILLTFERSCPNPCMPW